MSGIKELDAVVVPQGSTYKMYHGLETESQGERITPRDAKENGIFFPIHDAEVTAELAGGHTVPMPNSRAFLAETASGLVPLHMGTASYRPVTNEKIAGAISTALRQTNADSILSAMGTLNNLKTFFMSFKMGDDLVCGEKHSSYLNVTGGHDGTAVRAFLSDLRLTCMNTIQSALSSGKGFIDLRITHRGDINGKCADLTKNITGLIEGRQIYVESMEKLADQKVVAADLPAIVTGYYLKDGFGKDEVVSTRTLNAIQGITDLAVSGRGNSGESMYDVLNGATEYWTSGDGVGRTTSGSRKAFSSEFGTAARHKVAFANYLLSGPHEAAIEDGHRVLGAAFSS